MATPGLHALEDPFELLGRSLDILDCRVQVGERVPISPVEEVPRVDAAERLVQEGPPLVVDHVGTEHGPTSFSASHYELIF